MAYRAAKAFRATGSMEWMYQMGMETLEEVLIFGACNATWVQEFKFLLFLLYVLMDFAWTNLGDAQCSEATMKILNNVT